MAHARPGLERVGLEASLRDPDLLEHLADARAELDRGLTELLLARRDEIGHPDPDVAVAFVLDQLASMLSTRRDGFLLRPQLETRSDPDFVREALRSAGAYLQIPLPHDLESL